MGVTIKVVQLKHQEKKDGTLPILFRITEDRKVKYEKTGFSVKASQLRSQHDAWVYKHPDADTINKKISIQYKELANALFFGEGDKVMTLFQAVDKKLTQLEKEEKVAAYNRLLTNKEYLKEALVHDYPLNKVSKDVVEKYVNFRIDKGNAQSTIKKNLQDISTVLEYVRWKGNNEFAIYAETVKAKPVDREKLNLDEIAKLENTVFDGNMELAVDMYLFSYYLHGARFESVALMEREDVVGDIIKYRMNKGQKVREIKIHGKLRKIIDKYINGKSIYLFPAVKKRVESVWHKKDILGVANATMNKYLKIAAYKAGIDKDISLHVARHSFATNIKRMGVNINVIKDALGHSKTSMTEKYLKDLEDDLISNEVNKLYE
ncbi:tyrosine-type recombinase/integrase [Niabella sp. CC-SYL272]|uniref:site-specific integrase n=1 Tax=Niabella agricola TaxID=2891571 RepID=UPI001F3B93EB|nr:site-specific integrase [Niabella agricola]MCF3107264.1 tyrosine-type recombinase/integrase [Niabella agricola]